MKTGIGVIPKVILESPGAELAFSSFAQVLRIDRLGLRIVRCESLQSLQLPPIHCRAPQVLVSVFGVVAVKAIRILDLSWPS